MIGPAVSGYMQSATARRYLRQIWLEGRALRTLVGLLDVEAGERLLDVGTGPAVLLTELARSAVPLAGVVGIDASAEMLALAPELPEGWRLQVGNADDLSFPDESFDVVTASYLLHLLEPEQRRRVLGELRRVLRVGGRLGVITVAPQRRRIPSLLTAPIRIAAQRSQGRLAGLRPLDPGDELAAVGLEEVARERTMRGYPSLCLVATKTPLGSMPAGKPQGA